jgi:hypothetical protein
LPGAQTLVHQHSTGTSQDAHITKIVCVKSKLKWPAEFLKDLLFTTLSSEFTNLVRQYQKDGTDIIQWPVNHQVTVLRSNVFLQVIQGLFWLAKQAVDGCWPQYDFLGLLQMAHQETNLPKLPKTNNQVTGSTLPLLLALSSLRILSHYIGLSHKTGNQNLFTTALELIQDCLTPCPVSAAAAARARQFQFRKRPLLKTPEPRLLQKEVTPLSALDTFVFQPTQSLLKLAINLAAVFSKTDNDNSNLELVTQLVPTPQPMGASANLYALKSSLRNQRTSTATILIGNKLVSLPSSACWGLAMELHQILKPIPNHITMVQQLQL